MTGIVLLASGSFAMSLTVIGAAQAYADSVFHEELRIQADLNDQACRDTVELIKAKDAFAGGDIDLPEFGCALSI